MGFCKSSQSKSVKYSATANPLAVDIFQSVNIV